MEQDVSAYYNQTQNHYQRWWHLNDGMSLHYGLWYPETKNFLEALQNTNHYMAEAVAIEAGQEVLDAGCGVGGAAIYLSQTYGVKVTGLTLSELQVKTATENARRYDVNDLVKFYKTDYTKTNFTDESFDVIWACESSSSAADKEVMIKEWYRLLKPGGKLIILDFFKTKEAEIGSSDWLRKWCELWAMSPLVTVPDLTNILEVTGFEKVNQEDFTKLIEITINRMYKSYWLGLLPSVGYNLLFGARKYARNHYKSGLYQYMSFKKGLWKYHSIIAVKSDSKHINN